MSVATKGQADEQLVTPELSATARAMHEFIDCAAQIPGVLTVTTYGGKSLANQSILVEVPNLRSEAADQVYMLRRDLFRKYPDARLDVRLSAIHHGDADTTLTTETKR